MTTNPALLVTDDAMLRDDVHRLAAAAGVALEVRHDVRDALGDWMRASIVLVGADQSAPLVARQPPRHEQVHLLTRTPAADGLFRDALRLGARDVVELPGAEAQVVALLADALEGDSAGARTIGVVPGSGGAGASTFACALASVAASTSPVLLVDLDPWGPGLDRVAGLDDATGVRWDELMASSGRLSSASLRESLPARGSLAVLTFGAAPGGLAGPAVTEVLSAARRGQGLVVVDLPRTLDGAAGDLAARCDLVVMVGQATVTSVGSSLKVAHRLQGLGARSGLVLRTGGGSIGAAALADVLGLALLASYPSRGRVREQLELGLGPPITSRSPLARAARAVLGEVSQVGGA